MTDTIGKRLKKVREYRNLTLEKVEAATHIRAQFLRALEADDYSKIPSQAQARGFLRNYAEYLDLDLDQLVADIRAARTVPETETEIVFEGEQVLPSPEPEDTVPEEDLEYSNEAFWQTWLKRVRNDFKQQVEEPDSEPTDLETPDISDSNASRGNESGSTEEREIDKPEPLQKLWDPILGWFKISVSRDQKDEQPETELEADPDEEFDHGLHLESQAERKMSSEEITQNIGLQLRQRREMLSLTLEEIERHTRMRVQFLELLEKGKFDKLPSPVQTRGMLSSYARFLDLDVDGLLLQFAEVLQILHRERHPQKNAVEREGPTIPGNVPTLRTFIAGDMFFGVGMVLLLIIFAIWGISSVLAIQSEQQVEVQVDVTSPSISEALIGTPVETAVSEVTLIPAEDTPIPEIVEGTLEIPTAALNVNVQVNIVAVERTFLRVLVDGEVAFDGRTIPGNAYPFEAEQSVEILAGNGAALRVAYNQRDLGLLGGFGQVASFIYTADKILVPTPVVPPTSTNTPFVSPTPSITSSPTPTSLPEDKLEH